MKIAVAACELPHPQGTAAGRDLWAWCEAVRSLGHDLEATVWYRSPSSPEGPVPDWARYVPHDIGPLWKAHLRALVLPRNESSRIDWSPDPDAVAVADHLPSAAAVLGRPRSVVTLHYRALADARSVGRVRPSDVQAARAERRAARRGELVLAYSTRVGRGLPAPAHVVPIAYPMPAAPLDPVDEPVAALLADWSWPPNRAALDRLIGHWPAVRDRVPAARLLLAGRNFPELHIGHVAGVEVVGPVRDSSEVLGRAALIAFPCPDSSGPKVKVLEALAHGLPVVTSPAGLEGIGSDDGTLGEMASADAGFAQRTADLLADPEERRRLGALGRRVVAEVHSPMNAAESRLRLFHEAFGV